MRQILPPATRGYVLASRVMGATMWCWIFWRLRHDWRDVFVSLSYIHTRSHISFIKFVPNTFRVITALWNLLHFPLPLEITTNSTANLTNQLYSEVCKVMRICNSDKQYKHIEGAIFSSRVSRIQSTNTRCASIQVSATRSDSHSRGKCNLDTGIVGWWEGSYISYERVYKNTAYLSVRAEVQRFTIVHKNIATIAAPYLTTYQSTLLAIHRNKDIYMGQRREFINLTCFVGQTWSRYALQSGVPQSKRSARPLQHEQSHASHWQQSKWYFGQVTPRS